MRKVSLFFACLNLFASISSDADEKASLHQEIKFIQQVRVARPTDQLEKIVEFYEKGLGLPFITSFEGHAGYSSVILGLPNLHLEFTHHIQGSPCPSPTRDNLLVLYISEALMIEEIYWRLKKLGYSPVEPENPYWNKKSITFEDPDGWRVVLCYQ